MVRSSLGIISYATTDVSIPDYGNELEVGLGVSRAINEGLVTRSELFIVSKLWNTFHDPDRVRPICKRQLQDWGIDYFDLFLIHFPIAYEYVDPAVEYPPKYNSKPSKVSIQQTWTAMEGLVKDGLTRSIGICNFNGQLILDMLRYAEILPAALQVEIHPYLAQLGLTNFAQKNNIAVTGYWSFGPGSAQELDQQAVTDTPPLLFQNATITKIAEKYGKTAAQILLRWSVQRNVCVIPKSNNLDRLKQNIDLFGFNLSQDDIGEINGLNRNLRFNDPLHVSVVFYPSYAEELS